MLKGQTETVGINVAHRHLEMPYRIAKVDELLALLVLRVDGKRVLSIAPRSISHTFPVQGVQSMMSLYRTIRKYEERTRPIKQCIESQNGTYQRRFDFETRSLSRCWHLGSLPKLIN